MEGEISSLLTQHVRIEDIVSNLPVIINLTSIGCTHPGSPLQAASNYPIVRVVCVAGAVEDDLCRSEDHIYITKLLQAIVAVQPS